MKARAVGGRGPALMGLLSGGRSDGRRDGSRLFYGERRALMVQLLSEGMNINTGKADGWFKKT